ncbi:hypothetical protein [Actinokineospora sp.]|uniref:hypothetical protein n=1 Tax=Actinokineospora sp. TaxID=1872133 RepID=UPI003D6B3957
MIDLSKVSKPPQTGNRYFTYNSGEFYPVAGAEWMVEPIPGHVDPDYPWWVQVLIPVAVAAVIAAAMACVGSAPFCAAIAAGTANSVAPPVVVTVPVATAGVGIAVGKGIDIIDDAVNAGKAANAGAAGARSLAELRAVADVTLPSGISRAEWGALVWGRGGSGGAAATNANALLGRSADELSRIPGLNTNSATAWRDFYQQAIVDGRGVANPANATNQARLDLLNDIIHSLGGR